MKSLKLLFMFCIILTMLNSVNSELTEEIKDKWLLTGKSFSLDGKDIKVMFNDNESIYVTVGESTKTLIFNQTKKINDLIIHYDSFEIDKFDYEIWKNIYKVHITIYTEIA